MDQLLEEPCASTWLLIRFDGDINSALDMSALQISQRGWQAQVATFRRISDCPSRSLPFFTELPITDGKSLSGAEDGPTVWTDDENDFDGIQARGQPLSVAVNLESLPGRQLLWFSMFLFQDLPGFSDFTSSFVSVSDLSPARQTQAIHPLDVLPRATHLLVTK